jgi:hypothetical protein
MRKIIIIGASLLVILAALLASYSGWNAASPATTCAQCHEISHSFDLWARSAHRNIACKDCHGTALSEGMHSLKEKAAMLFYHKSNLRSEDVRISEDQRMEVMQRCITCHQIEYAKWNSGGHAVNYSEVFLNTSHNKAKVPYDDCLRCHGMFFDKGTIRNIIEPLDTEGPWKLKNESIALRPAIPCFACHEIHQSGFPGMRQKLKVPSVLHYSRIKKSFTALYYRRDSMYFPVSLLPIPTINYQSKAIKISDDVNQRLCTQCHAPNAFNIGSTGDDHTPRGVHEAISCLACHDSHSNSAIESCKNCHPAISNCKLDVEKMNTTYSDKESKNNIHFVSCTDCHLKGRPKSQPKP